MDDAGPEGAKVVEKTGEIRESLEKAADNARDRACSIMPAMAG